MHVAIIMDGNGRWAEARGLSRTRGHRAGAVRVEDCVRAAPNLGIRELTLYAFSTENWKRPSYEITSVFRILRVYFNRKVRQLTAEGVRVRFIGRRDQLPGPVQATIRFIEEATRDNMRLRLNIAVDYGGQDELIRMMRQCAQRGAEGTLSAEMINEALVLKLSDLPESPPPDLVIRTGGERRLSNFLLWHIAYSELDFVDVLWPDFVLPQLEAAIERFRGRSRRFGGV